MVKGNSQRMRNSQRDNARGANNSEASSSRANLALDFDRDELSVLSEESRIIIEKVTSILISELTKRDQKIAALEGEVGSLKTTVTALQEKLTLQEEKVEYILQDRQKHSLVMSGIDVPVFASEENAERVITDTIQNKLGLTLAQGAISRAHRIGAPPQRNTPDKRPIKFTLTQPDVRKKIIDKCIELKPRVYFNEFLTPYKNELFRRVRAVKRETPELISQCFVSDGIINIRKPNNRLNIKIRTQSDFESFLRNSQVNPTTVN